MSWVVDFQFRLNVFAGWRLFHDHSVLSATWASLYGADISLRSAYIPLLNMLPSQADLLRIDPNAFVSNAKILTSTPYGTYQAVHIESYSEVGLRAVVGGGSHLKKYSGVAPLTYLAPRQTLSTGEKRFGNVTLINSKIDCKSDSSGNNNVSLINFEPDSKVNGRSNSSKDSQYFYDNSLSSSAEFESLNKPLPSLDDELNDILILKPRKQAEPQLPIEVKKPVVSDRQFDKEGMDLVDEKLYISRLLGLIKGLKSSPITMQQLLKRMHLDNIKELTQDPSLHTLLHEEQSFDPYLGQLQALLPDSGPFSEIIATLARDFLEGRAYQDVDFGVDVIPVVNELLHWIVLVDAVTTLLFHLSDLWTTQVLPQLIERCRGNFGDKWFLDAKANILIASACTFSNSDLSKEEAASCIKVAYEYSILLAVAAEVANNAYIDCLSDNIETGHILADLLVRDIMSPDSFSAAFDNTTSAWQMEGLSNHFFNVYRSWNAIFIAGSRHEHIRDIPVAMATLFLPKMILSATPENFIRHRFISLLLAIGAETYTPKWSNPVISTNRRHALISSSEITLRWAKKMPERKTLSTIDVKAAAYSRKARLAFAVQDLSYDLKTVDTWNTETAFDCFTNLLKKEEPLLTDTAIEAGIPEKPLLQYLFDNVFFSGIAMLGLRIVLIASYIICILPAYELANYLLFHSGLSRPLSIVLLSTCFPVVLIVLSLWSTFLVTIILGRNARINRFACPVFLYTLTHNIMDNVNELLMHSLKGTIYLNFYYSLMGATIGRNVFINALSIREHFLITIGSGAIIDDNAYVVGHQFVNQVLEAGTVLVAPEALMHPTSTAMPGSHVAGVIQPKTLVQRRQVELRGK
eukprot:Awhi_evm1s14808